MDIRAFILHLCICSHLTTELLIYCARVYVFGELMWHRAAKDDFPAKVSRLRLDRYADIEAALDPCGLLEGSAGVFTA